MSASPLTHKAATGSRASRGIGVGVPWRRGVERSSPAPFAAGFAAGKAAPPLPPIDRAVALQKGVESFRPCGYSRRGESIAAMTFAERLENASVHHIAKKYDANPLRTHTKSARDEKRYAMPTMNPAHADRLCCCFQGSAAVDYSAVCAWVCVGERDADNMLPAT